MEQISFERFCHLPEAARFLDSNGDALSLRAALQRRGLLAGSTITDAEQALAYLPLWRQVRDLVVADRQAEQQRAVASRFHRSPMAEDIEAQVQQGIQRLRILQGRGSG